MCKKPRKLIEFKLEPSVSYLFQKKYMQIVKWQTSLQILTCILNLTTLLP